jgi:hypothetical protein
MTAQARSSARPRIYITDFLKDDLAVEKGIVGDLADVIALGAEREAELDGRIEDVCTTKKLSRGSLNE